MPRSGLPPLRTMMASSGGAAGAVSSSPYFCRSINRGGCVGGGGGGGGRAVVLPACVLMPSHLCPGAAAFFHLSHRRRRHQPPRRAAARGVVVTVCRSFGSLGGMGGEGEGSAHQIAALVLWLRQHGVDFTDRAQFCRVRHMGVGGVATRDFNQGDVIFSLPLYGTTPQGAGAAGAGGAEAGADSQSRGESSPLVMTTSLVTAHTGPLGALGRALSVAGLTTQQQHEHASSSNSSSFSSSPPSSSSPPRHDHLHHNNHNNRPSHRLGGIQESDHDFPLNASHVSLLALGLLHQSALAAGPNPTRSHWRGSGSKSRVQKNKISNTFAHTTRSSSSE